VLVKLTIDGAPSDHAPSKGGNPCGSAANFAAVRSIRRGYRARSDTHSLPSTYAVHSRHIACTGNGDEWHPEFEPLYAALAAASNNPQESHEEAAKFSMASCME